MSVSLDLFPLSMCFLLISLDQNELQRQGFAMTMGTKDSRMGSLTLLVYSTVALCMAVLLPNLVSASKSITMCHLWIASHGLFGISMLGTFLVSSSFGTVLLFGIVGFSWATSAWVPYALLGAEASRAPEKYHGSVTTADHDDNEVDENEHFGDQDDMSNQLGLIYGIHNLSICAPQILICLGMGLVLMLSGDVSNKQSFDTAWVLRLGGVFALVAMYIATGIQEPFRESSSGGYVELRLDER